MRQHRVALLVLAGVSALGCLALGWWQWSRFESGGTAQNLGYALQWPLFAAFVVYAYRRFVQLEREDAGQPQRKPAVPREIPPGLLPQRPQPVQPTGGQAITEYNRYLAELSARDRQESR